MSFASNCGWIGVASQAPLLGLRTAGIYSDRIWLACVPDIDKHCLGLTIRPEGQDRTFLLGTTSAIRTHNVDGLLGYAQSSPGVSSIGLFNLANGVFASTSTSLQHSLALNQL